ncbi:MAG: sugar phosphate isomerase/epimerase, partial [Oceanispirochaeta sp.]|nr:sugar phosphate isomerase/epimerase [Oceanispirochaeta sp.]
MLNIGIRAHDLGKMTVENLSEKIGEYGFSHIQLALKKSLINLNDDSGRLSPGMGNYIRDCFYSKKINISVLGCYINPVHPVPAEREKSLTRFAEHLIFARSFGCSVVGTETGSPLPDSSFTDEIYKEKTFQDFIASLKR